MVAGAAGCGKTTFINTLCSIPTFPLRAVSSAQDAAVPKTLAIVAKQLEIEEDGLKLTLNIIDTPGFAENINNTENISQIMEYVEKQFDEILSEESRIKRNPKFQGFQHNL